MRKHTMMGAVGMAVMIAMLSVLGFAASASAKLTGEYTKFQYCPYKNTEEGVRRCIQAVTNSGEVKLGNKKVPIVNPVTLQGGYSAEIEEGPEAGYETFFAATNGETLTKVAQPVPGGLAGFVNCKEIGSFLLRISCEGIFENGLTGVNSTLELALPASAIRLNEVHLAEGIGIAMKLPVKAKLDNPLFGSSCYVGSASSPLRWNLSSGFSEPPAGITPIEGKIGEVSFLESGRILRLTGNELVDNGWSAPSASGCGGLFSFILDPIVSASSGLPSAAGNNVARLKNTVSTTTAAALKKNDAENP